MLLMDSHTRSWPKRLFSAGVLLALSAWLLRWAWELLLPALPALIIAGVLVSLLLFLFRRR